MSVATAERQPLNIMNLDPAMDEMAFEALAQDQTAQAAELATSQVVETQARESITRDRFNRLRSFARRGSAVLLGSLAMNGLATQVASAETPVAGTPEVTSVNTTFKFNVAGSSMSEQSFSKATVLGNHRVKAKAQFVKAEAAGDCITIDGKKVSIWTQGHYEKGNPYGKDTRTSRFCLIGGQWYREACGNRAALKLPKRVVPGRIIWVNDFNKASLKVSAKSLASAQAQCKTENTMAMAYGHGEASASASVKMSVVQKIKGKISSVKQSAVLKMSGSAESRAKANAVAICAESTPPPQPVCTGTPEECHPKPDAPNGAGEGTPGNTNGGSTTGGQGAGGSAGNPTYSVECYDSPDNQNGDLNPDTQDDTMYVQDEAHVDQYKYCIGQAQARQG